MYTGDGGGRKTSEWQAAVTRVRKSVAASPKLTRHNNPAPDDILLN